MLFAEQTSRVSECFEVLHIMLCRGMIMRDFVIFGIPLWEKVETWIRNLGMKDYHLTDRRKIIGDLENTSQINIIILNTKKTIFQSRCDGSLPTILQVKYNVKQCYLHDRYKSIIHNKEYLFGKKWSLFSNTLQWSCSCMLLLNQNHVIIMLYIMFLFHILFMLPVS